LKFTFYKYQGTGNDFIMVDNRELFFGNPGTATVANLCDRRFGIGADGLILLENDAEHDFKMVYYNSDGNESSMCGNGGRCLVKFASKLGLVNRKVVFTAVDGLHEAVINEDGWVSLKMKDVNEVIRDADGSACFLDTGSPHYIKEVGAISEFDVFNEGKSIRYSDRFREQGTNVNFIEKIGEELWVRTYERGVENETFSCGTGVTAAALAHYSKQLDGPGKEPVVYNIQTLGGALRVRFVPGANNTFSDIWLEGPAEMVFEGTKEI
jgi:diaminopimelate epimerase